MKMRFYISITCQKNECVKNIGRLLVFVQNVLRLNPKKTINVWDKTFKRAWALRKKWNSGALSASIYDDAGAIGIARSAFGLHSRSICGVYILPMKYFVYIVKQ